MEKSRFSYFHLIKYLGTMSGTDYIGEGERKGERKGEEKKGKEGGWEGGRERNRGDR